MASDDISLDDFKFVNTTFENEGGHIYIDGGKVPLTKFVFENCTFLKAGSQAARYDWEGLLVLNRIAAGVGGAKRTVGAGTGACGELWNAAGDCVCT